MGRRSVLITAALVAVASPITLALVHQGSGTSDNRSGLSAVAAVQREGFVLLVQAKDLLIPIEKPYCNFRFGRIDIFHDAVLRVSRSAREDEDARRATLLVPEGVAGIVLALVAVPEAKEVDWCPTGRILEVGARR